MMLNICTKFHENIFEGFKVTERTQFSYEKNSKRHNFAKSRKSYGSFSVHMV